MTTIHPPLPPSSCLCFTVSYASHPTAVAVAAAFADRQAAVGLAVALSAPAVALSVAAAAPSAPAVALSAAAVALSVAAVAPAVAAQPAATLLAAGLAEPDTGAAGALAVARLPPPV